MPQLMPLMWLLSVIMIMYILLMLINLYYYSIEVISLFNSSASSVLHKLYLW